MKAGDKYVIEIEEVIRRNGAPQIARIKGFNTLVFDQYGLDKSEPYENDWEKAYRKGYEDGIADGNICDGTFAEKVNIAYQNGLNDLKGALSDKHYLKANFGTSNWLKIIEDFEPDKIVSEWLEWKNADIKVGDEVVIKYNRERDIGKKAVVSKVSDNGMYNIVFENGKTVCLDRCFIAKTGRHFDAIAEVLSQMQEGVEE